METNVFVIGTGEVGGPLLELIKPHHYAFGIDINPVDDLPKCDLMHICFPYVEAERFINEVVRYVRKYQPQLTIINSTVGPGTTRRIADQTASPVVYSPVRGKHVKMQEDMLHYVKFVGAMDRLNGQKACAHFQSIGMRTKLLTSPEAAEIAKLTETSYFGLLIAWAQEVERYCDELGADYDEAVSFYEEVKFFPPVKYVPGVIGGHCVMPNIKILQKHFRSGLLDAIERSNDIKVNGLGANGWKQVRAGAPAQMESVLV
jgi:UDP-glucose 6-dehydrogenase